MRAVVLGLLFVGVFVAVSALDGPRDANLPTGEAGTPVAAVADEVFIEEKPDSLDKRIQRLEDREAVREFVARYEAVVNDIVNGNQNLTTLKAFIGNHFTEDCIMAGTVVGREEVLMSLFPVLQQFRFLRHYVGGLVIRHINSSHAVVEGPIGVVGTYQDGQPFASSMHVTWKLKKKGEDWKFHSDTGYFDFWVRLTGLWGEAQEQQQQQYYEPQYAQQPYYQQPQYAPQYAPNPNQYQGNQ